MNLNEDVVAFCSYKTKEELNLPSDVAVCCDLIRDYQIYMVPKDEFLEWLERGEWELMS